MCDNLNILGKFLSIKLEKYGPHILVLIGFADDDLFDDISLVLKVRRLCVVVDSRISAAKV